MLNTDVNVILWYIEGGGGSGSTLSSDSGDAPIESPNATYGRFSLSPAWTTGIVFIGVFFVVVVVLFFFLQLPCKKVPLDVEKG